MAPLLYLVSVAGLVLVLTPVGSTVNGSHSWILLPGGFSVQPSEFAKVALCLGLAIILGERIDRQVQPGRRDLLAAVLVAAVPIGLVMLQPDLGSALVLGALAFGVLAVGGTPKRYLAAAAALVAAGVVVALTTPVLSDHQRDRLTAFADPQADPQGIGYQTRQVRIAIGSGGWQGQGLFEGRQTQGGFIPYQQTDFVFSVAGEELGFLGAAGLLLLLGFVVLRAVLVAARAQDAFGRLMAAGVAVWFLFQVFENVGMNLGITPVTGLPCRSCPTVGPRCSRAGWRWDWSTMPTWPLGGAEPRGIPRATRQRPTVRPQSRTFTPVGSSCMALSPATPAPSRGRSMSTQAPQATRRTSVPRTSA